jgi:choline dehydrogenase-like flavoprotein
VLPLTSLLTHVLRLSDGQFETYHGAGNEKTHGYNGPIQVSDGGYKCARSEQEFIDACTEVGYPEYQDMQDLDSNNGTERWMRYVSPEGKRQDAAHCYLHPLLRDGKHPNLHVLCETKVVRVLFDGTKRATGVEYTPNPDYVEGTDRVAGSTRTIRARKLVVVSCGAINSPLVLERSGVGDQRILEDAGVAVVEDLPGVGHDYQDHNLIFYPYRTDLKPHETMDAIIRDVKARDEAILNKSAILRWNTCDVSAKIRPTDAEVAALGPAFQKAWNKDFKDNSNRPLMLISLVSRYVDQGVREKGEIAG